MQRKSAKYTRLGEGEQTNRQTDLQTCKFIVQICYFFLQPVPAVEATDHNVIDEKVLNSAENAKDQSEDKYTDGNPKTDLSFNQDFIPLELSSPETSRSDSTPKVIAQVEDKPNDSEELPPYQPPFQKDRKQELEKKKLRLQKMREEKV